MAIIEVEHVTKEYRLGAMQSLKSITSRMIGRNVPDSNNFKALDDISFSIERGEVVGIIGHNGAGKSTLLKLLSNITQPSSGRVLVAGKIAPLIEVGAGLVSDMTGRENIYLNASILGMKRADIHKKLDEIIEFSELQKFIDTPIKRYSSGMQVRLGFAIATSINAEILIVDEVLSVGDLAFQKKCLDRMDALIRSGEKTVLLVSHNLRQIERICSRALMLDHGKMISDGDSSSVCEAFYSQTNDKVHLQASVASKVESSGELTVSSVDIIDSNDAAVTGIYSRKPLRILIKFFVKHKIAQSLLVIGTHTTDFIYLHAGSTGALENRKDLMPGHHSVLYETPYYMVAPGTYCVRFSVYDGNNRAVFVGEGLCTFRVLESSNELGKPGSRLVEFPGMWKLNGEEIFTDEDYRREIFN